MSDGVEIDRFIKDPSLLVELCREVIDEIDAGTEETHGLSCHRAALQGDGSTPG